MSENDWLKLSRWLGHRFGDACVLEAAQFLAVWRYSSLGETYPSFGARRLRDTKELNIGAEAASTASTFSIF